MPIDKKLYAKLRKSLKISLVAACLVAPILDFFSIYNIRTLLKFSCGISLLIDIGVSVFITRKNLNIPINAYWNFQKHYNRFSSAVVKSLIVYIIYSNKGFTQGNTLILSTAYPLIILLLLCDVIYYYKIRKQQKK